MASEPPMPTVGAATSQSAKAAELQRKYDAIERARRSTVDELNKHFDTIKELEGSLDAANSRAAEQSRKSTRRVYEMSDTYHELDEQFQAAKKTIRGLENGQSVRNELLRAHARDLAACKAELKELEQERDSAREALRAAEAAEAARLETAADRLTEAELEPHVADGDCCRAAIVQLQRARLALTHGDKTFWEAHGKSSGDLVELIVALKRDHDQLLSDSKTKQKLLDKWHAHAKQTASDIIRLHKGLQKSEEEKEVLSSDLDRFTTGYYDLRNTQDRLDKAVEDHKLTQESLDKERKKNDSLSQQLDSVNKEHDALRLEMDKLAKVHRFGLTCAATEEVIDSLHSNLRSLDRTQYEVVETLRQVKDTSDVAVKDLAEEKKKTETLSKKLETITQLRDEKSEEIVKRLMQSLEMLKRLRVQVLCRKVDDGARISSLEKDVMSLTQKHDGELTEMSLRAFAVQWNMMEVLAWWCSDEIPRFTSRDAVFWPIKGLALPKRNAESGSDGEPRITEQEVDDFLWSLQRSEHGDEWVGTSLAREGFLNLWRKETLRLVFHDDILDEFRQEFEVVRSALNVWNDVMGFCDTLAEEADKEAVGAFVVLVQTLYAQLRDMADFEEMVGRVKLFLEKYQAIDGPCLVQLKALMIRFLERKGDRHLTGFLGDIGEETAADRGDAEQKKEEREEFDSTEEWPDNDDTDGYDCSYDEDCSRNDDCDEAC